MNIQQSMISIFIKIVMSILIVVTLPSCAIIEIHQVYETAANIRIYNTETQPKGCVFIADVVGSEGHWYNSIYISNSDLVIGALSDVKNQTADVNADTAVINDMFLFATSVTIYAQAFDCQGKYLP